MTHKAPSLFDWKIAAPAVGDAFIKLNPAVMIRNPVMFVTMIGAILTTVAVFTASADRGFIAQLAVWLWFATRNFRPPGWQRRAASRQKQFTT